MYPGTCLQSVLDIPKYCLFLELLKPGVSPVKKFWLANSLERLDDLEEPEILLSCSYVMKTPDFG